MKWRTTKAKEVEENKEEEKEEGEREMETRSKGYEMKGIHYYYFFLYSRYMLTRFPPPRKT